MVRRFPVIQEQHLGYEGTPLKLLIGGVSLLVIGSIIARSINSENKIENTKRHHPKGIGYTSISNQMDNLRDKAYKTHPHIQDTNYEYSKLRKRHLPFHI